MAGVSDGGILKYFRRGAEVEISSDDAGFRGSWYEGTVIRPPKNDSSRVLVEYKTLMADDSGKRRLKESLRLVQLRPPPPSENRATFEFSDEVDAYYNDGWWEGIITKVLRGGEYRVFFRGTREELDFGPPKLRLHREWVKGTWVPPFDSSSSSLSPLPPDHMKGSTLSIPSSSKAEAVCEEATEPIINPSVETNEEVSEHVFNPEELVEASSNEEGLEGAWFTAKVVERTTAGKYIIQYEKLRNDDDTDFLREEVDGVHLRPFPPDVLKLDSFEVDEEVDAWYNDCWWVGVILKNHTNGRYTVYFENDGEDLVFDHCDLRVHQEWRNGKWRSASHSKVRKLS